MNTTAFICPRHESVHVNSQYHAHMAEAHDGRSDCILGITDDTLQAILDGTTTIADAFRRHTMTPIARTVADKVRGTLTAVIAAANTAAYCDTKIDLDIAKVADDLAAEVVRDVQRATLREATNA